jgi:hypothetical protein
VYWRLFGIIMTVIYPIGVPLFFFLILYRHRTRLDPPGLTREDAIASRQKDKSLQAFGFLWLTYEPRAWWFESFEAIRRLALTGMLVLCFPGSVNQILIGMAIAYASMRIFSATKPYLSKNQDFLMVSVVACVT